MNKENELRNFINRLCFGDCHAALDIMNEFETNFSQLIRDLPNMEKKELITALHNLSGSAGLMGFLTLSKELKKLELYAEKQASKTKLLSICQTELKGIHRLIIQPILTQIEGSNFKD